ncbi:MAG: hypothetical protein BWY76_02577 [bacterium ADurb.Bin429]|nr:MAG: hypothetical protein BWY76_02577 [bacterium ADurb.Bin429]
MTRRLEHDPLVAVGVACGIGSLVLLILAMFSWLRRE